MFLIVDRNGKPVAPSGWPLEAMTEDEARALARQHRAVAVDTETGRRLDDKGSTKGGA